MRLPSRSQLTEGLGLPKAVQVKVMLPPSLASTYWGGVSVNVGGAKSQRIGRNLERKRTNKDLLIFQKDQAQLEQGTKSISFFCILLVLTQYKLLTVTNSNFIWQSQLLTQCSSDYTDSFDVHIFNNKVWPVTADTRLPNIHWVPGEHLTWHVRSSNALRPQFWTIIIEKNIYEKLWLVGNLQELNFNV